LKKISLLALALLLIASCTKNKSKTDGFDLKEHTLKNGLHLIMIKNKKAPATEIRHWVKSGSLHESKNSTGLAHLFEHMMFRPLKKGDPSFDQKLKDYGVQVNANTRFESTLYTTSTPQEYLKEVLAVEAERFMNLKVDEELLTIEKEAVRSEYSTKMDANPVVDLWESIYRKGYTNHPYKWMIIGERADLDKITADNANLFFNKFYRPNNTGLIISGDIDFSETKKWVTELYGKWEKKEISHSIPKVKMSTGLIIEKGNLPAQSKNVLFAHRTPQPTPDNFLFLELTNFIFYGSDYSLGDRILVTDKKMVSSISPFNFRYDNGMMKGFVQLLPGVSLESLISEINAFPKIIEDMSDKEFKAYWDKFRLDNKESLEKNVNLANMTALSWGKYGETRALTSLMKKTISKSELVNFINKYIKKDNMVVLTNKNFEGVK